MSIDELAGLVAELRTTVVERFDNVDRVLAGQDERLERLERLSEGHRNLLAAQQQQLGAIHQELANLTGDFGDFLGRARRSTDRLAELERRISVLEGR
jgi:hypothetical protein